MSDSTESRFDRAGRSARSLRDIAAVVAGIVAVIAFVLMMIRVPWRMDSAEAAILELQGQFQKIYRLQLYDVCLPEPPPADVRYSLEIDCSQFVDDRVVVGSPRPAP